MNQVITKNYSQPSPISPPSTNINNLNQLINFDPILSEYFKTNCSSNRYWSLAHELMLDGLRYRAGKQKNVRNCCCSQERCCNSTEQKYKDQPNVVQQFENKNPQVNVRNTSFQKRKQQASNEKTKHYNVSYIKHNRFLSPSQKKQVITPKVTEMIPFKSTPLVIYGKPRVRIDDQIGCPYHNNEQECLRSIPYGGPCQPKTARQMPVNQLHIQQKNAYPEEQIQQNASQLQRYKSSPNLNINKASLQLDNLNKTKKNQKKVSKEKQKQFQRKENNLMQINDEPGQTIYVNRIVEVQSRVPGKMRIVQSPKAKVFQPQQQSQQSESSYQLDAKYQSTKQANKKNKNSKQVESRIKFLIERDKRNKAMQKNMKKQEQRIKILEKIVQNEKKEGSKNAQFSSKGLVLSSSSSQMSQLDSRVVDKYKNNTSSRNQLEQQKRSAHFVGQDKTISDYDESDSISCSKTLTEQNNINIRKKYVQESSFSQF